MPATNVCSDRACHRHRRIIYAAVCCFTVALCMLPHSSGDCSSHTWPRHWPPRSCPWLRSSNGSYVTLAVTVAFGRACSSSAGWPADGPPSRPPARAQCQPTTGSLRRHRRGSAVSLSRLSALEPRPTGRSSDRCQCSVRDNLKPGQVSSAAAALPGAGCELTIHAGSCNADATDQRPGHAASQLTSSKRRPAL